LTNPFLPNFAGKEAVRTREKIFDACSKHDKPISEVWRREGPAVPQINDLVRTRVECQFLDGVEFFADHLATLATDQDVKWSRSRKGGLEGYFAQHFYFDQPVVFRFGGGSELATLQCEIQIATALATRLWEESHKIYEHGRTQKEKRDDWQWNPTDPRFVARQLGHMIHLADGLLVQLRNTSINEAS